MDSFAVAAEIHVHVLACPRGRPIYPTSNGLGGEFVTAVGIFVDSQRVCVLAYPAEEELEQTFNQWNHCRWDSDFEVGLYYYFRIIRQGLDPSASRHQNQRSPRE